MKISVVARPAAMLLDLSNRPTSVSNYNCLNGLRPVLITEDWTQVHVPGLRDVSEHCESYMQTWI